MGSVVDMTGRTLVEGEEITATAGEQLERAELREIWESVPEIVREWADGHELQYPAAVELMVHSLLTEALGASEKHERAGQVLEFIGSRFFAGEDVEE
jgi:hypothetical protein